MKITYKSVGVVSLSMIGDLVIGKQVDTIYEGIKPTYGMLAGDMGFRSFIMTIKWGG